jgi:hypothetical protein
MPRNVRAFWISAKVDGRRGPRYISFGPPDRLGSANLTFTIRGPNGEVKTAFSIECSTDGPNKRNIIIRAPNGGELFAIHSTEGEPEMKVRLGPAPGDRGES